MIPERSSAIEQGVNPDKIYRLIRYIKESHIGINALMILKNGKVIAEANYYPYHREVLYGIDTCTVAVIATLTGIAIKEGLIKSVNERVLDFFPDILPADCDPAKHKLTIEHLLKMTMSIEWNDVVFDESNSGNMMWASGEQVKYILERPMVDEPGKSYNHCLGGPHLLSAILQKVTGMSTATYAEEKLFKPLDINATRWHDDNQGITLGCYGLSMKLYDMAKIGQLHLQKGNWNGVQIIPEEWVEASAKKQVDTPFGPWNYYGSGYLWSMNRFGGYCVKSLPGFSIFVLPRFDIVVAIAGSLSPQELHLPETLVETYVIPAAKHSGDKGNNLKTQALLDKLMEEISKPQESACLVELPEIAGDISGNTYIVQPTSTIENFSLDFVNNSKCMVKMKRNGSMHEITAGLDGIYRVTSEEANKGCWKDDSTFVLDKKMLDCNAQYTFTFVFENNKLTLKVWSSYAGEMEICEGWLEEGDIKDERSNKGET